MKCDIISKIEAAGIKVARQRGDELECFCHEHDEKRPSFMINLVTGKYQCFSCGIRGRSLSDLIYKISGKAIDFEDDEEWLCKFKSKLYPKSTKNINPSIPANLQLAINNNGGYFLQKRYINKESVVKFNLLYWEAINGIVIPADGIGYIIRFIEAGGKEKGKYQYVFGSKVNNNLFGISQINQKNLKSIILVEGSLDVIYMHQLGWQNTLGLLHSSISDTQVRKLEEFQLPIYLMLDHDKGGLQAEKEIIKKLKGKFLIKTCRLSEGKDPNDCNKEEIQNAINGAKIIL
jgi:DNA primase